MTSTPTPDTPFLERRRMFDELIGRHPIPSDVHTREIDLDGVSGLEVGIDGIASSGTLVWIHGGAFLAGSARIALAPAAAIARTSRMRVLSVDYPLAPEHPFPAALDTVRRAFRTVLRTADGPVTLGGESAGGALALALLVAERDAGAGLPRAAAVFSPVTDLTVSGESIRTKADIDPVLTGDIVRDAASAYLGDGDRTDPLASPLFADLRGLPPLLIQAGGHEILLDDAVRVAARAASSDVDVTLEVAAGRTHVFQSDADTDPVAARAALSAGRFLRERAGIA